MARRSRRDRPRPEVARPASSAPLATPGAPDPAPLADEPASAAAESPGEPASAPAAEEPAPAETAGTAGAIEAPRRPSPARAEEDRAPRPSHGLTAFFLHLHPRLIRRRTLSVRATLGLGLATAVALGVVTLSGLLLLVHYVPSLERAHASLQDLETLIPLGAFVRRLHRLGGHAAVILALLHLARALLWGSYRGAHRRVWLLGALLLLTTLATSFSGYLLPWDQDAYWTVTVGTSLLRYIPLVGDPLRELLLGGPDVGQGTLTRFFVLHVLALPALGSLLLLLHLFRLRRAGGLARPPAATGPGEELCAATPELPRRELALTLAVLLGLTLAALLNTLELGPAPDLARPDNPPKAPWFFVGLQELVSYSASFGGVAFPALLCGLLLFLPWLDGGPHSDGEPFATPGARRALPLTAVATAATGLLALRWWGDPQAGTGSWLNPASLAALAALATSLVAALRTRSRALFFQVLLAGLLVAMLVFTLAGWFWRGPDWSLGWHPGPGRGVP